MSKKPGEQMQGGQPRCWLSGVLTVYQPLPTVSTSSHKLCPLVSVSLALSLAPSAEEKDNTNA